MSLPPTPNGRAGKYVIEYHAKELIDLDVEVRLHPEIMTMLKLYNNDKISRMNAIAAACNVVMQGIYDENDYREIAIICRNRLYERRTGLAIPASIIMKGDLK